MADSRPNHRILGIGELGRLIMLAFVSVAVLAVVVVIAVGAASLARDARHLVTGQQARLAGAASASAAAAYDHGGWTSANLAPVLAFVARSGAALRLTDAAGRPVAATSGFAAFLRRPQLVRTVIASGRPVGRVTLRFGSAGYSTDIDRFLAQRWRVRLLAAALAVLLAGLASFFVARRIAAPLERLLEAMRARQAGNRDARIRNVRSVGVLREVLEGFNASTNALDARDRVQRNLVANMAHEVRTPVAVLQAGLEAIQDGLAAPSQESITSLHDEVARLSRMLDDLQDLASAESAALQLKLLPQDLAEIAAEAVARLAESFEAAGISLEMRLTQAPAECDQGRMREVVTNLLTNALKFTPRGGRVVVESGPDGRHLVMLRVSDTGIGISAEDLPLVTERFFRGERTGDMAPGSGIGMAIVSELVRAHHGELNVASQPGKGTTVTVTMPRAEPD
ncbi:MAG TPA: HAMP domain-containing sensor histidine kinase [Streptosporangiaceae bacterium]|nr:HAMP domain-containing sensor histidine kinase [Streptosporangiaceae bacterium]